MVYVPTEKRYEKHIETELNNLIDDGLQFHSKIHKKDDTWYDKNLCVVGDEFITFLKESHLTLLHIQLAPGVMIQLSFSNR